jgi:hypothetical protein
VLVPCREGARQEESPVTVVEYGVETIVPLAGAWRTRRELRYRDEYRKSLATI